MRQAIGDSGEAQRLIRTIPRKGFRFIGEVREDKQLPDRGTLVPLLGIDGDQLASASAPASTGSIFIGDGNAPPSDVGKSGRPAVARDRDAPPSDVAQQRRFAGLHGFPASKAWVLVGAALAGLLAVVLIALNRPPADNAALLRSELDANAPWRTPSLPSPARMDAGTMAARGLVPLVVLPFISLSSSDDRDQRAADAITEDLTDELSRFSQLRVIAHRTALVYSQRPMDVAAVRAELGVRYVVEGSVRSNGSRLRVSIHLVDAASRLYVWTDHVDRDHANYLEDQDEIAKRLARALEVGVTLPRAAGRLDTSRRSTRSSPKGSPRSIAYTRSRILHKPWHGSRRREPGTPTYRRP